MWQFLAGLTGTAICLALAHPFRKRNMAPNWVAFCHFLAGVGLAVGIWGAIADAITGFLPQQLVGLVVIVLTAIFGIGVVLDWKKDRKLDKQGQWIVFFIPMLLVMLPGALGQQTEGLMQKINTGTTSVVSHVSSR
jgi:hypothetical protein